MPKLHLTVLPDGKCVVTTEDKLTADEKTALDGLVTEWLEGKRTAIVLPDCDVVRMGVKP